MRSFKTSLAAAALALSVPMMGVSAGHAAPLAPASATAAQTNGATSHDVTNVYYRRWGGGYGYRGGYYRHGGWGWGGAAAGLAAGAIIGGAIAANSAPYYYGPGYYAPPPGYAVDENAVAYCSQRYKSYDPASGTFLGYDGLRHPCP